MIVTGWQLLGILVLVSSSAVALTAWACSHLHEGDSMVRRAENAALRNENAQLRADVEQRCLERDQARNAATDWARWASERVVKPRRFRGTC